MEATSCISSCRCARRRSSRSNRSSARQNGEAHAGATMEIDLSLTARVSSTARVARVWLNDFRCFRELDVELAPGLTVLFGANAVGKTSLLEAVAWAARGK